ncbi:hypothetical protein Aduo_017102 [Ancylostoma duodenale]
MKLFIIYLGWNTSTISTTIEEVICGDQTDRTIHQQMATGATLTMETQRTTGIALTIEEVVGGVRETDHFVVMVDGQTSATVMIVIQMNKVIALMAVSMEKETAHSVLVTKETEFLGIGLNTTVARLITELLFQLYLYVFAAVNTA